MDRHRPASLRIALGAVLAMAVVVVAGALPDRAGVGLRVLQMNLCNSGWASCYTGESVRAAAQAIRADRPDVVTLNEVCRGDVATLARAFAPGRPVTTAFTPAIDRDTGRPVVCQDGEPYGIGILSRAGADAGATGREPRRGVYPIQDPGTIEGRAWLCAVGAVVVCTTHLANANPLVALAQCRYLFTTVVALVAAAPAPVVVGGDFNLDTLSTCMPGGYTVRSDGGVQFVATRAAAAGAVTLIGLHRTTDHPGLLVRLSA